MNSIIVIISKMGDLAMHYSLINLTAYEDFTHFEPHTPQYKKLKKGEFFSLSAKITDQNGNVMTDGPQVTVVLHIHDCK